MMDKIEDTLKGMKPWKALGPNGMHVVFLQQFWDVAKMKVCQHIINLFTGIKSMENFNIT